MATAHIEIIKQYQYKKCRNEHQLDNYQGVLM